MKNLCPREVGEKVKKEWRRMKYMHTCLSLLRLTKIPFNRLLKCVRLWRVLLLLLSMGLLDSYPWRVVWLVQDDDFFLSFVMRVWLETVIFPNRLRWMGGLKAHLADELAVHSIVAVAQSSRDSSFWDRIKGFPNPNFVFFIHIMPQLVHFHEIRIGGYAWPLKRFCFLLNQL